MKLPASLSLRLMLAISLWSIVALALTGLLISNFYRSRAETDFRQLLLAHAYNLMGAVETNSDGQIETTPNLGEPRFLTPASGWYWAVSAAENPQKPVLSSPSLVRDTLTVPTIASVPFNDLFRRSYTVTDAAGMEVERLEAQLFFGDSSKLFQVMIAGDRSELEDGIANFNFYLLLFLGLFGAGTIAATFFILRVGFRPLDMATHALVAVRHGEAERVEGSFPNEIQPFVSATNDLIDANRDVLDRARTQVGNLAHALKTPLAVISNETAAGDSEKERRIAEQTGIMQDQITSYLSRAQISAQRSTVTARTTLEPVMEKLTATMSKLFRSIDFEILEIRNDLVFGGEQHDLEEIVGNLLENAAKHAKTSVSIDATAIESEKPMLVIVIEDDGPGISPSEREVAVKRGVRLDERQAGSGLGLSIVSDIAADYGGRLELDRSSKGGLKAAVFLPRRSGTRRDP